MARAGLFGEIYYAEGGYIHDCHEIQYDADGNPTWRVTWQVGRNGCTYGTHSLGPVLEWLDDRLASGDVPRLGRPHGASAQDGRHGDDARQDDARGARQHPRATCSRTGRTT